MNNTYFTIARDKQFAYFCRGCLEGKTKEQISRRDIRYCLDCQALVEREYGQLRQRYIPVPYNHQNPPEDPLCSADKGIPTGEQNTKMSMLNSETASLDNFKPRGRPKTYKKRQLPEREIKKLYDGGMGAWAIATKLKKEEGIDVSYKTIQRILSGERK
jgi:hypothetical protein